jgi:hypothetical protein
VPPSRNVNLHALVLIDHALRHRAQNADVKERVGAIPGQTRVSGSPVEGPHLEDPDPLEA